MVTQAGKLDRRIVLQAKAQYEDGDPTDGQWQDVKNVGAEQMDERQLERFTSDQTLAEAIRGYSIRYYPDIDPTWRVKDEFNDYWYVVGVAEGKGRRRETVLLCSRYDPNDREFE